MTAAVARVANSYQGKTRARGTAARTDRGAGATPLLGPAALLLLHNKAHRHFLKILQQNSISVIYPATGEGYVIRPVEFSQFFRDGFLCVTCQSGSDWGQQEQGAVFD